MVKVCHLISYLRNNWARMGVWYICMPSEEVKEDDSLYGWFFFHLETLAHVSVSIYEVVWHSRATCVTYMSCKGTNVENGIVFRNLRSMCV